MPRIVVFVALVFIPFAGCSPSRNEAPIVASGHVEATEVRVSTKVGGIVVAMPVAEGDRVEVAQELARLDTTDTRLALDAARGERGQAAAQLDLLTAGARAEDVADAEAQVQRFEAEKHGAERDLERMAGLLASGSGTVKARDDASTRRDVAAAALASARERLSKLKAGARTEEIAAARARLAATDARMAQLDQQSEDATITSPAKGIVTEKLVEPGELVERGTTLVVITNLDDAWLTSYISEQDLGRIRLGQKAAVVTDNGERREGTLSFIAPKAEFTPKNVQTRDERVKLVYKIKVRLENKDGLFKPGMPAEAHIVPQAGS
ncbi:MAG: efflux RND transporter periplasmic adaptor subunit [Vicinamibacteria bacterium]|nr:efflux RND transporter periplasmic adaptor subunit [Vicinamibacteria bacterium]